MSEEALPVSTPDARKVIVRRVIRREKSDFLGLDSDILHWGLTGLTIVGLGGLVLNEYLKKQEQQKQEDEWRTAMAAQQAQEQQAMQEQQQAQAQPVQQSQPVQQQPVVQSNYYPEMNPNNQRNTVYDGESNSYVIEADGSKRKVKSRFGDMISIA